MNIIKKINIKMIFFIIIPLIVSIYCYNKNFIYDDQYSLIDFWILPFIFFICETITYKEIKKTNRIGVWALSIISVFRYVITILLYYWDINNSRVFFINDKTTVIGIMSLEIICIYVFIYFYSKYHKDIISIDRFEQDDYEFGNLTVIICIIAYFIILIRYPTLIFKSDTVNISTDMFYSMIILISNFSSIIIALLLLKKIKDIKISNNSKIIFSLIVSIFFSIILSINGDSVSRWTMVLNLIIFVDIVKKYYIEYKKLINMLLAITLIILLIISTQLKFRG